MNVMKLIIFYLCIRITYSLFGGSFKKLKQKAKDAYMKKFKKNKTWHFLGNDLTEYPGINTKYRQLNEDKWNAYYNCLKAQDLSDSLTIIPEAIIGFESNSIDPLEMFKQDSIEWKWAKSTNNIFESIEYNENILLQPEDRSLRIYDLKLEQTGQYICQIGETQSSPYFLTILSIDDDNNLRKVHPESSPTPPYPIKMIQINDSNNLYLDTQWGQWTACSKCNQIGRRYRLGYCIVKYNEEQLGNSTINIPEVDYELLKIFQNGIPCQSHILPYSIKNLKQVQNRSNEIMSGYCKVNCPDDVIFEVRDKNGNIIERVNNSAGIYSMIQGPPLPQPSVVRQIVFGVKDEKLIITCPGNLNSDLPIEWQIGGSKKIIPELIKIESNGRIYISITDKIHIKNAKISDTNIYSCWQGKELAGTVRLIVENRLKLTFNHHIMLFGIVVILFVFLYVFAKSLKNRKYI